MENNVQHPSFWTKAWRLLVAPYRHLKWLVSRLVLRMNFYHVIKHARQIELHLQAVRQRRDNLNNDHTYQTYLEAKGFCDGVEWCLNRGWEKENE